MMFRSKLCISASLLLAAYVLATTAASVDAVDIAVYTCGTGLFAYVNLAFLSTFGGGRAPVLDLAGHCDAAAGACASLAADIAACQSAGVKVLLSIGGGALGGYNLSSPSDARGVAAYLWDNFLGGGTGRQRGARRRRLRHRGPVPVLRRARHEPYVAVQGRHGWRPEEVHAHGGAAVPVPGRVPRRGLFDRVWVQFYNNPPCQYAAGDVAALRSAWRQWTAGMPSTPVFLGLPASPDAADSGFVDADALASQVLPVVGGAANFGGIMLWSRSYDKDSGFSEKLQGILQNRNNQGTGTSLNKKKRLYKILGVAVAGVLLLFLLICTCFLCHKKYRGVPPPEAGSTTPPKTEPSKPKRRPQHLTRYTFSEVERMTKNFAHELGHGSCGDVYRGNLRDGYQVAVKVLNNGLGDDKEFMREVVNISRISHVNVVSLIGFCLQGPTGALIYEYMPNGSLENYAFNNNNDSIEENYSQWLYWEKLFDIANARGRDAFYDAPEVVSMKFGPVTSKSDVYSYGVMVLEMVRAKRNISVGADTTSKYFARWLYENLDQFCDSISDISSETRDLVKKMIIVGLWCIQTAQTNWPSLSRVVEMLESSSVDLELPVRIS